MTVNEICNMVCEKIKEGWGIEIHLENGSGTVELVDPNGLRPEIDASDMTIEEQIKQALYAAHELPF